MALARVSEAAVSDGLDGIALGSAARISPANAERSAHRLFGRWGLSLKVQMTKIPVSNGNVHLKVPVLLPSAWVKCLLESYPSALFGGCKLDQAPLKCSSFWKGLYQSQSTHAVFERFKPEELQYVLPLLLHGDEGTGSKKQPIAIGCCESVFCIEDDETRGQNQKAKVFGLQPIVCH